MSALMLTSDSRPLMPERLSAALMPNTGRYAWDMRARSVVGATLSRP